MGLNAVWLDLEEERLRENAAEDLEKTQGRTGRRRRRDWSDVSTRPGTPGLLVMSRDQKREEGFSPRAFREHGPASTLISDCQPPEPHDNILVVLSRFGAFALANEYASFLLCGERATCGPRGPQAWSCCNLHYQDKHMVEKDGGDIRWSDICSGLHLPRVSLITLRG